LSVVYPLDSEAEKACYIDVVAVHGIFERSFHQAWSIRDDEDHRISWLIDANMLPTAISHLRVLNFQYDPQAGREGLRAHLERTSSRLKELTQERILSLEHRPVIFVAHGYGGLVVLKALIAENLAVRTVGVVCLATPFRIDDKSLALPTFPWSTRSLDEAGVLRELLSEFRNSPLARKIQFRCFYESQSTKELVISHLHIYRSP
jgi:pimeloyl-ACP methyl ester carboxylesterase